ncbi:MAG: glycosyltransferase [Candidatus Omnitrophota bacterium]
MKILIAHAYAGIGHKKAAEAVHNALSGLSGIDVQTVDTLDYTNAFFKFSYPRVYLFLINKAPLLWACLYYLSDFRPVDFFCAPLRRFFHNTEARRFVEFVLEEKPDVVLCTHFMPAEIISGLKKKDIFKGKLVTLVTDFLPHSFWMALGSDYFIAAIERTKKELMRRGINAEKIKVMGIPCDPVFSISKGRSEMIKKLGIKEGLFNLLIMGGGFGTGPVKETVYALSLEEEKIKKAIQVIVICGKNEKLYEELNSYRGALGMQLSAFGYMNNVDEFMETSDCIITKSGGLTISEALSKKLPMIIIQPIPGQETRNCRVLTGYGTAVRANNVKQVLANVRDFINYPERIIGMKTRSSLLSYPGSAKDIANFISGGLN